MRGIRVLAVVAAVLATAFASSSASAMAFNFQLKTYFELQKKNYVSEGGAQVGPLGHAVFCTTNTLDCGTRTVDSASFVVGPQTALLRTINAEVNSQMKPRPDARNQGFGDTWTVGGSFGDCEDYALTKMSALIERGLPANAMRIAVVKTKRGEPHALLIARTLQGDVVLDNINQKIVSWDKANYNWLMIQSSQDMRKWRKVNITQKTAVAGLS